VTASQQLTDSIDYLVPQTTGAIDLLSGSLQTAAAGISDTSDLVVNLKKIEGGLGQLNTGVTTLQTGLKTYTAGVSSLNSGLSTLTANNATLQNGASSLSTGASSLYTGLDSGVKQLNSGVNQLSAGTKKLVSNNATILSGTAQLSDGATQISDGAGKLRDGSAELGDGLNELTDGTLELKEAMSDGQDEIRDSDASDDTLEMFSAPVEVEETQLTTVENNGHAMAAYMFSVGLWVGCLAFCLMYPLAKYTGKLTSGRAWWASKAVVLYPLSILMVVLLLLILHVTIGFNPASMLKTFIVGIAAVAAFMSIMYFFNLLLGKVGSFLMLLFMVLQLAGSAGTYPIEISGSLANALHKWMPFTYSVEGFRAAIAGNGPSIVSECAVLFGISIVFTLLTILVFGVRAKRTKENKPFIYEWIEEKGLA
jgi:putative membrane protein